MSEIFAQHCETWLVSTIKLLVKFMDMRLAEKGYRSYDIMQYIDHKDDDLRYIAESFQKWRDAILQYTIKAYDKALKDKKLPDMVDFYTNLPELKGI